MTTKKTIPDDRQVISLEINKELWRKVGVIAKETGLRKGALVENILRASVEYQDLSISDLFKRIGEDFMKNSSKYPEIREQLKLL